jgi:hypothetical protein
MIDLARHYGVDTSGTDAEVVKRLERAIYKYTDCGAWIQERMSGVLIGSIVEGSDAEFSTFLTFPFKEEDFSNTIQWLEAACSEEWHRANEEG